MCLRVCTHGGTCKHSARIHACVSTAIDRNVYVRMLCVCIENETETGLYLIWSPKSTETRSEALRPRKVVAPSTISDVPDTVLRPFCSIALICTKILIGCSHLLHSTGGNISLRRPFNTVSHN